MQESNGDAHVGFREGDDRNLSKWAKAQRRAFKEERLEQSRMLALVGIGFRFSDAEAEWLRWYSDLKKCKNETGIAYPNPLVSFYRVITWSLSL